MRSRPIIPNEVGHLSRAGGCPLGTGDIGIGGLGYWLKSRSIAQETHDVGTVSDTGEGQIRLGFMQVLYDFRARPLSWTETLLFSAK